jgi:rubredoxin
MYDRTRCGVNLGLCKKHDCIHFTCPQCGAQHDRGYVGYAVGTFRCMRCGYSGHALHPDQDTDRKLFAEWESNNALNRSAGVPEMPFTFPDSLNGPG